MEGTNKKWQAINFAYYLSFVKWPTLFAAGAEIIMRIAAAYLWPDLSANLIDLAAWVVRIIALVYVGYRIGKQFGEVPPMGALAGSMSGLLMGFIGAAFRFASGFRTWKLFNLLTESLLSAIIGALISFLIVYIWDLLPEKIKK